MSRPWWHRWTRGADRLERRIRAEMFGEDCVDLELAIEAVREMVELPYNETGFDQYERLSEDARAIVGSNVLVAQRLRLLAEALERRS